VWKEKVDDYAAGYSMTAAPLIANGLLLTGVSGGEFGVVGTRRGDANPKTGELLWKRPMVEGHMGYRYDKDGKAIENGVTGTTNKSWPGDLWKTGGASTWMGGTYDSSTGLAYFGTGNPAPWNSHLRPGDNLYSSSTVALDVKTGQIKWALPEHAERLLGLRRRQRVRHLRHERQAPGRQGRPQRLLLRHRRQQTASCRTPSRS
jgi:alcohol dehydrogenase (cytochrome c)